MPTFENPSILLPGSTREQPALRRELTLWIAIAAGALAIAGLFAALLAFSRVPDSEAVFPWPAAFFHKGLVIHVIFSFVVWFVAVFCALTCVAAARLSEHGGRPATATGMLAALGTMIAAPLLFIPALLDRGEPTLNNYVPIIIDPLYYVGLAVLAFSAALAAVRLLATARPNALRRQPVAAAVCAAAVIYLLALLCFTLALAALGPIPFSHDFNEALTWGGGHILQFANTLLLMVAWCMLASPLANSGEALRTRALAVGSAILLLGALAGPAFYSIFVPFSAEQTRAFTLLQYLLGPSAAVVAVAILLTLPRPWPWREIPGLALLLSMALFATGGVMGLFVDGFDTRTPAHYHGVIAAVTLSFFGLFFTWLLPALGRPLPSLRRQRLIIWLFAGGQWAACIGLFLAGGHGAPRKVAGEAQGLTDVAAMIGMGLNGLGGLIAIVGGILFIWSVFSVLLRAPTAQNSPAMKTFPL